MTQTHIVYVRGQARSAHASRLEALCWIRDDRERTRRSLYDYAINRRSWRGMVEDRINRQEED